MGGQSGIMAVGVSISTFEWSRMSAINFFWSELRMSLGKQKNLIILGAVAAAFLVAGVLVADYANVLPGRTKTDEQVKACDAGEAKPCCAAETEAAGTCQVVAATEAAGFPQVMAATDGATTESCSSEKKAAGECADATAGCEKPAGCCEEAKAAEASDDCCAAKTDAATE